MFWLRRGVVLLTIVLSVSFIAWFVPRALDPTSKGPEKRALDRLWVNTSPYFWDRQACRWIGVCGLHHLRRDPAANHNDRDDTRDDSRDELWAELRRRNPTKWEDAPDAPPKLDKKRNTEDRRRILKDVPDYVIKHAPLVHLYSGEEFWPSDIRDHVEHMSATVDGDVLNVTDEKWSLHNLDRLNKHEGKVMLQSNDDVESRPEWLHSHLNMPTPFDDDDDDENDDDQRGDDDGPALRKEKTTWYDVDKETPLHRLSDPRDRTSRFSPTRFRHYRPGRPQVDKLPMPRVSSISRRGHKPDDNGYSKAPAVLIVVDKGSGIVDAFWFFFYSYNLGQTVFGIRFGNHVGDWEHCMMRFEHGEPRGIFFSEHEGGQAYAWDAVEKRGDRPVIYSAVGSHAMYALPGDHDYILPFKILKDVTDKGPIWDPALNNYAYHYDYTKENPDDTKESEIYNIDHDDEQEPLRGSPSLVPAASNPAAPTSWFHYRGRWGDEVYSLADPRQWRLFGQYHYVTGPGGPKFKNLDRAKLCPNPTCRISYKIDPKGTWY